MVALPEAISGPSHAVVVYHATIRRAGGDTGGADQRSITSFVQPGSSSAGTASAQGTTRVVTVSG